MSPDIPLACDMNAIPAAERDTHEEGGKGLFSTVLETQELPDGYAFRFPSDSAILWQVATFVANERLCCPFFRFEVVIEPDDGPLWLKLTGQEGVKQFVASELTGQLATNDP